MDEKRTAIAVLVSICAILLYSELVMDPYIKQGVDARAAAAREASVAPAATGGASVSGPAQSNGAVALSPTTPTTSSATALAGAPTLAAMAAAGETQISNDSVVMQIALLGGRIKSYQLKKFNKHFGETELTDLVSSLDQAPLPLGVYVGAKNDGHIIYKASPSPEGRGVILNGKDTEHGFEIRKIIDLAPIGYVSNVTVEVVGSDAPIRAEWSHFVSADDGHARLNPVSFKVMGSDNKLTDTIAGDLPSEVIKVSDPRWIGFSDRYFLTALIGGSSADSKKGQIGEQVSDRQLDGSHLFSTRLGGSSKSFSMRFFGGPKIAETLAEAYPGLERTIDLGWFSFLAFPLLAGLKILYAAFHNWGLAIVALTLCLKALFLPLTKASFGSMKAMQALQPEMKAMREKIKDPTVLNQEMLKLYQKHKVNPMGGCLPMILQIPVFIGLYNVLLNAIELRHAPFALWILDLSSPEKLMIAGVSIPLMVIILGVSMFFQQYMTPSAGLDPTQRKVMLFMPLVLTGSFLVYPLPAGLVLYWVVNNTISIVQQAFLKTERSMSPYRATAIAGALMFAFAVLLTRIS